MKRLPSRRRFLKETLAGLAFLSLGQVLPRSIGLAQVRFGAPSGLLFFSAHEYHLLQAIAERILGSGPADTPASGAVDVALRADNFLASADPDVKSQIHQLLSVFNSPLFTFLFDLRFSSFVEMAPDDQDSYLEDWMTSSLAFRRTGFQALKHVVTSMYYTDERSWEEIGYHGMFLPWERP